MSGEVAAAASTRTIMNTRHQQARGGWTATGRARRAGGFSLVEVLIAIFVLALGLLGLAAVFPAVVRQQRAASDAVQGISMQRSIEELLRAHALLSQANLVEFVATPPNPRVTPRGWAMLTRNTNFSDTQRWAEAALAASPTVSGITLDPRRGTMFIGADGFEPGAVSIEIPIAERLIPRPSADGKVQPRFVWDFVARRVAAGRNPSSDLPDAENRARFDDDTIQLAVFVRRIDQGIRVPAGGSLGDVLTQTDRPPAALPVAEDQQGLPTFDGIGGDQTPRYSPIRLGDVTVEDDPSGVGEYRTISLDSIAEDLRPFLEQLGQKFVDARGIVHEVVRVEREPRTLARLTIAPPIESSLVINNTARVLYTPQVPASVAVISIRR